MQLFIYILIYPLLWIISRLPFRIFYLLSDFVCFIVYNIFGYRKKVVRKNLRLSFPEKSEEELISIEKRFYQHMCDLFLEMVKSLNISKKEIQKRMKYHNLEIPLSLEKSGKSFIILCGHYASYEWLASVSYYLESNAYAIYTPLTNRYFDRLIKNIRMKHHLKLLSRYDTIETIQRNAHDNEIYSYGFVADQSPSDSPRHYRRKFMGVEVPVFTGAERTSKKFDLAIIYCRLEKVKRGYYEGTFELLAENPEQYPDYQITDTFFDKLEKQIREKPEFYLWTHNRFKHRTIQKKPSYD